jgi:chemotaxis protein MotB
MARMRHLLGLATVSLALTGCVPQEKYAALKLDDDRLREQLGQAQTETAQAQAEANALKQELASNQGNGASRDAILTNLTQQNANLQAQLDALNQKYADAIGQVGKLNPGTGSVLPEPLTNELSAFAAQNPDLVEFDASRGMVKFKSDVTFAVGDASVTPKAKEVLSRFASILDSAGASQYELLVAGHTDSTPVVNPATIRNGHKNNWYLSAHRAITVGEELIADGVNSHRLGVVGYADTRPIASNSSEDGKARNRRVEVLILPTTVRTSTPMADAAPTHVKSSKHTAAPTFNKDTNAATDQRPVMNK